VKRLLFGSATLAVAGVFLAGSLLTVPAEAAKGKGTTVYNVKMVGSEVVPGPGDADGRGKIQIKINKAGDEICWKYAKVKKIDLPGTAAHIHSGAAGVAGTDIVTLGPPDAKGKGKDCATDATAQEIADIKALPHNFYVDVHTGDFPDGAIRGQLAPAPAP
jgi:hypothetical protein